MQASESSATTASAALGLAAVMTFGAVFGLQHVVVNRETGFDVAPEIYWQVYAGVGVLWLAGLWMTYNTLKIRVTSLLLQRTRRATLTGSDYARQYLLRRELTREKPPIQGFGGPVPDRWKQYLNRG